MRAYDEAVKLLPSKTAAQLGKNTENAEEFRLRIGFEPTALIDGVQVQLAGGVIDENDIGPCIQSGYCQGLYRLPLRDTARIVRYGCVQRRRSHRAARDKLGVHQNTARAALRLE